MTETIDWNKLWNDFDKWYNKKVKPQRCTKCKYNKYNEPEWDEQQRQIQRLINAQVRKLKV